jgi:phosphoribosylanthranilate isomerase
MRVRVKICGITNPADAESAAKLGADAIGLNFYPPSPRAIDAATASGILQVLPPFVEPVALFVNQPPAQAQDFAQRLTIRTLQMHGDHHAVLPAGITRWILAFSIPDAAVLASIQTRVEEVRSAGAPLAAVLVDAHVAGKYGGTGQTAPWHLLAGFDPGVPVILAGGLTAENVTEAIRSVRPYAVDVAGGVESAPGKKDAEKMRRFIDAVQEASACV